MGDRSWATNGPRVFGYEPGWLWWAALFAAISGGLFWASSELDQRHKTKAYLLERAAVHAARQGLDQALVYAVIQAESGWDWQAQSPVGAKGLMQVTDIALKDVMRIEEIDEGDLFDVDYNLHVGTLYLAYLLDRFEGEVALAVAAYHMGPTAIAKGQRKHPALPPRDMINKHAGPQTRAYVKKVLTLYEAAQRK